MIEIVFPCWPEEYAAIWQLAARSGCASPQDVIAIALYRFATHLDLSIPINLFAVGRTVR